MMIYANFNKNYDGNLIIGPAKYSCWNYVRTLKDKTRFSNQVVRSVPSGQPYDPHHFPAGVWDIIGVRWQNVENFDVNTYGPCKIITTAHQMVPVWELDEEGDYKCESPELKEVDDTAYWLHFSKSNTTLGCIHLASASDAQKIGKFVEDTLWSGEKIQIGVKYE
jgi:hypothetical protein